jgi:hypothetical protein
MHTKPGYHSIPGAVPITITSLYRHNRSLAIWFSAQKQRIPQLFCLPTADYACKIEEHRENHGLRLTGNCIPATGPATILPGAQDAIINNAFWQILSYCPSF